MDQEHSQIPVSTFRDAAQVTALSGAVLARREPEPRTELTCAAKSMDIGNRTDQSSRRDDTNARDAEQPSANGVLFGECGELPIDLFDLRLKIDNLLDDRIDSSGQ